VGNGVDLLTVSVPSTHSGGIILSLMMTDAASLAIVCVCLDARRIENYFRRRNGGGNTMANGVLASATCANTRH